MSEGYTEAEMRYLWAWAREKSALQTLPERLRWDPAAGCLRADDEDREVVFTVEVSCRGPQACEAAIITLNGLGGWKVTSEIELPGEIAEAARTAGAAA